MRISVGVVALVALTCAASTLEVGVVAAGQAEATTRVSVGPGGVEGNGRSGSPAISADGRWVAFGSSASNLVAGDTNGTRDVFVYDRQTGTTTLVSVATDGTQAQPLSDRNNSPAISADGRWVAFSSDAANLVAADTNGVGDVFVHDRQTGTTTRVSVSTGGAQGNGRSGEDDSPAISADGRWVAFSSHASNLVPGDTNDTRDVFVHDRVTATTTRVNLGPRGIQAFNPPATSLTERPRSLLLSNPKDSWQPAISADGRWVAFESWAPDLVTGDTNNYADVFVHDRQTGTTTRVSVATDGSELDTGSYRPAISADGRWVAFWSSLYNPLTGTNGYTWEVFVRDRQAETTTRMSGGPGGVQANGNSAYPAISADGRRVAFWSRASDLIAGDTNGMADVFVYDRDTGVTTRVSVGLGEGNADSGLPAISADGRWVAFDSLASNFVAGDTNSASDVFVHDRGDAGCAVTLAPASVSAPAAATTGTVMVLASTGCAWTAVSDAPSWLTVTDGASGTGFGTVSYGVAAHTGEPRTGTITIGGQTFTVNQASLPTLAPSPSPLRFGAINTGSGTLTETTPSQQVTVTQSGIGSVTWTAAADQPWLQITSGSGTGSGTFTVSVISAAGLPATGTVSGTVMVNATGANNSPAIPVSLTLHAPATTAAPFGVVDTPLQDAAGVVGSIGVTGWALDDLAVSSVKLYRNCLWFEPVENCQWIGSDHVVYMGDADIVPGARPDVEAAFPAAPQAHRAGWGYLLLTNVLPHIPNQQMFGGQGAISIYVFATDVEGHQQLLGRPTGDLTPTTITMTNDTLAKPFGAIDTPGQGQTVSGALWNFGWALTPDNHDSRIRILGLDMWAWIDGAAWSRVTYNLCRGTVGSPPPAGVYCDDDVANVFGNAMPQPPFTTRTGNPTPYRNLDEGSGAIGAFYLDTTTLANGRHSIVWSVTDTGGRTDGIGSRDFIVLNSGSLEAAVETPTRIVGDLATVTARPVGAGGVWGRTGFDPHAPWETVDADAAGTRHVRIPQRGRLELWLGSGVTTGYVAVNGTLRPLPAGSQLRDGVFTWAPPVAYFGAYDLVFLDGTAQVPLTVTILPTSQSSRIEGYIDAPTPNATVRGAFTVAGWAADPSAWNGSGIGAVHVWATPTCDGRRAAGDVLDVRGATGDVRDVRRATCGVPRFIGVAELGLWRADVAAQLGAQFERAGWSLAAPALPPGEYDIVAYFWSTTTQRFEDGRVVRVSAR